MVFGLRRSQEVPPVSGDVEEHRDTAVRFSARLTNERDASLGHPFVRGVEVIDSEEEPDPTGRLVTNRPSLAFPVRPSKEDACLSAGRPDDHPALGSPVIGQRWRVLDEVEPEHAGEEFDGRVVLIHDQSNQVDLHLDSVGVDASFSSPRDVGGKVGWGSASSTGEQNAL
jgi:hypothetical protein